MSPRAKTLLLIVFGLLALLAILALLMSDDEGAGDGLRGLSTLLRIFVVIGRLF